MTTHARPEIITPVDEAIDAVFEDALHLLLHLLLLCHLDLGHFGGGVHTHSGAEDLRRHASVTLLMLTTSALTLRD